ncbi:MULTISPECIES: hypothetical protein [Flavobacteriaceae]|uniref:hypothetical protein n=1 Tax=Flavobacteriaceae TaxID=49546 RepID=UPI001491E69A|nr:MULTISPECIES: hypothetical protein [Allomuricauda]MDC6364640.1 hypothetical protein [Muricauda sp. AC10]
MEDQTLPAYHQSIFHQLFEHASDLDCQLLLLEQILELGDEKDIPLLELLQSHEHQKIQKLATQVKKELLEKLQLPVSDENKRYPMSLCFIYDEFNIRPTAVDDDLEVDFEVGLDIFESEE